jgi:quercetin dioxygenase-like cupin family protein
MRADVERFGIDDLVAADSREPGRRPRLFAVQVPELTSVEVHWHDYYELGLVLDGHAEHAVNGQDGELAPGGVFLLSPADFHSIRAPRGRPLVMVNAVLHPDLVERTVEAVGMGDPRLPWSVAALEPAAAQLQRVREEIAGCRPGWDVVV